ncbi:hypothetical protein V1506DRAFT_199827 [Lipomyces tetrasporus]
MNTGLSPLSKAETVLYALGPIRELIQSELVANALTVVDAARESSEVDGVELSWSLVADYVAVARAYARLKTAQARAGWLPLSVDEDVFWPGQMRFDRLAVEAVDLCSRLRAVDRFLTDDEAEGRSAVVFAPMLHLDATWGEKVWDLIADRVLENVLVEDRPGRTRFGRKYMVPWILANVLYRHVGVTPGGREWETILGHFDARPDARITCKDFHVCARQASGPLGSEIPELITDNAQTGKTTTTNQHPHRDKLIPGIRNSFHHSPAPMIVDVGSALSARLNR